MNIEKTPSLSGGQMKTIGFFIIVIVIAYAAYVILQRLGLIRSKGEKAAAATKDQQTAEKAVVEKTILTSDLLDPNYQNSSGVNQNNLLSEATSEQYATKLHDSMGKIPILEIITSNVGDAIGVIQQLWYAPQLSQLADSYFKKYGLSLSENFAEYFSKDDLLKLYDAINKIPK